MALHVTLPRRRKATRTALILEWLEPWLGTASAAQFGCFALLSAMNRSGAATAFVIGFATTLVAFSAVAVARSLSK